MQDTHLKYSSAGGRFRAVRARAVMLFSAADVALWQVRR